MLPFILLLLVLLGALKWLWMQLTVSPHRFPPLVPGFFHFFQENLPRHFLNLAQKYGPLYRLHFGMQNVVVLNSMKAIEEAFLKKLMDFSGRPKSFSSILANGNFDLSLGDYTPLWKVQRKMARSALLGLQNTTEHIVRQVAEDMCKRFLAQPGPVNISEEFSWSTCKIICSLSFGEKKESKVQELYTCVQELMRAWDSWQIHILDILPILRFFPIPGLKKLRELLKKRDRIVQEHVKWHKETMVEGQIRDLTDFMLQKLMEQEEGPKKLCEKHVHMSLVDLFIGGTETTSSTLSWTVVFLLHHPETQRQLQKELDRELGPDSSGMPNYGDRYRFPLLNATITEVLRLRPAAPLALPHCTKQPSSICGFNIPKNTIIIPNIYGAHHDDTVWAKPYDFWPDRFLEPQSSPSGVPFSCGARVCLGEALARVELFLFLAYLLRTFTILPAPDSYSLPSLNPSFGTILKSQNYQVWLLPRETGAGMSVSESPR